MRRVANRPHETGLEVLAPTDEIDHGVVRRIEEHAVDREIAAPRVLFRRREAHFRRVPAVKINAVSPEGRDLELEVIFQNDDDAEMCADRIGTMENFLHLGGARVSCDVEIFWSLTADEIAHAAAGEVGDVAGCAQSIDESACGRKHCFFLNPSGIHRLTLAARAPAVETRQRRGGSHRSHMSYRSHGTDAIDETGATDWDYFRSVSGDRAWARESRKE